MTSSQPDPPSTLLPFKVLPNASRNQIVGWESDAIKIRIQSPPVDGKGNKALVSFLAKQCSLPKSGIRIKKGEAARQKWIAFDGIERTALLERLGLEEPSDGE